MDLCLFCFVNASGVMLSLLLTDVVNAYQKMALSQLQVDVQRSSLLKILSSNTDLFANY